MEDKKHCQICERDIKARTGVIAHHGYQRPGGGWQTASCWGARHLPYEESCDQIQPCIDFIKGYVSNQKKAMKELMENPPETFTVQPHYFGDKRAGTILTRPEGFDAKANEERGSFGFGDKYAYEHHSLVSACKREISNSTRDMNRLEKRLANWKPAQ